MEPIYVHGENLPDVWEKTLLAVYTKGMQIPTQYDKEDSPLSYDATVIMHVDNPFAEPRIHKNICMGLDDLYIYIQEVVSGIKDHWINPDEGKWSYTYHQRLFDYPTSSGGVNQIEYVIKTLKETSYSRRAVAITFCPGYDYKFSDPPCLQMMVFRVVQGRLNLNVHMRSNDLYKATFPNMIAFTELQKTIAERLSVPIGEYTHIVDSMHIYGDYLEEFKVFMEKLRTTDFSERVWRSDEPVVEYSYQLGRERVESGRF